MAEIMSVFTAVSQSLHSGEPLHQILPASLQDRLLYHHAHANAVQRSQDQQQREPTSPRGDRGLQRNGSKTSISEQQRPSSANSQDGRHRAGSLASTHLLRTLRRQASMLSVVSNAYTATETVGVELDTGVREEAIGSMVFYEDKIQDVNFMFFASAVSAVKQVAGVCLSSFHILFRDC